MGSASLHYILPADQGFVWTEGESYLPHPNCLPQHEQKSDARMRSLATAYDMATIQMVTNLCNRLIRHGNSKVNRKVKREEKVL